MERPRTEKLRMEIGEADRGEAGNEGAERGEAWHGPMERPRGERLVLVRW